MPDELSMAISLARRINLGNYESADVFLSLSGITATTTAEEMDQMLDVQGALAYSKLKAALNEKIKK